MTGYIEDQAGDGQQGQVGHRQRARRRRQLGRLVARRAEAEQAPEGGGRAGRVPDQRRRARSRRSSQGQPAVVAEALRRPGVPRRQERVLQRRPGRRDLRRGAKELKPVYLGPKNQAVRDAVENAAAAASSRASSSRTRPGPARSGRPAGSAVARGSQVARRVGTDRLALGARQSPGGTGTVAGPPPRTHRRVRRCGPAMSLSAPTRPRPRRPDPQPAPPPAGRDRGSGRLSRLDIKVSPYLYIAPFFVLFGVFGLFPLVYTLLGVAARLEPAQRRAPVRSAWTTTAGWSPTPVLLERAVQHPRHLRARHRAAAAAGAARWPTCSTGGCAAGPSAGWRDPRPERHLGRRGRRSSSALLFGRDFG